jgi:hypothetical protein
MLFAGGCAYSTPRRRLLQVFLLLRNECDLDVAGIPLAARLQFRNDVSDLEGVVDSVSRMVFARPCCFGDAEHRQDPGEASLVVIGIGLGRKVDINRVAFGFPFARDILDVQEDALRRSGSWRYVR